MVVHHMRTWCWRRSEEGVGSPVGTAVLGRWESPYGCWESNLGPLQEQQVLFLTAEPSPVLSYQSLKTKANSGVGEMAQQIRACAEEQDSVPSSSVAAYHLL